MEDTDFNIPAIAEGRVIPYGVKTVSYEESAAGKAQTELEQLRKEVADYHAKEDERHREEAVQTEIQRKKNLRNNFIVAAFGAAFALFLEHICDIIQFFVQFFKIV